MLCDLHKIHAKCIAQQTTDLVK